MNKLAPKTDKIAPSTHIFSKMQEFGADEKKASKKLKCLGNLLHNYGGLNGMKDDFT